METSGAPMPVTEQQRPRDEIKQDFASLGEQDRGLSEEARPFFEKVTVDEEAILKKVEEDVFKNKLSKEEIIATLAPGSPEHIVKLVGIFAKGPHLLKRNEELEKEDEPYLREDVINLAQNLSSRLDFDAFMRYVGKKRAFGRAPDDDGEIAGNIIDEFFFLRRTEVAILTGAIETDNYSSLTHIQHTLDQFSAKWESKNFLKPEIDPNFSFRPEFGRIVARKRSALWELQVQPILNQLKEFQRLSFICRSQENQTSVLDFPLEQLASALRLQDDGAGMPYGLDEIDFDPRLIEAAERWVGSKHEDLIKQGKVIQFGQGRRDYFSQALDFYHEDAYLEVRLLGLEEKEDMFLVVKSENLRSNLKALIPPYFIRGITDIRFTGVPIKRSETSEGELLGSHLAVLDKDGKWVSSVIVIHSPVYTERSAIPELIAYRDFSVLENTIHEIAHKVHYTLTLDEMEDWDDTRKLDPTFVTIYVKTSQKEAEEQGWREDFAESFMLFYTNPALLEVLSVERYIYMYNLLQRYATEEEKVKYSDNLGIIYYAARNLWEKNGITLEEVRKNWLAPIETYEGKI